MEVIKGMKRRGRREGERRRGMECQAKRKREKTVKWEEGREVKCTIVVTIRIYHMILYRIVHVHVYSYI